MALLNDGLTFVRRLRSLYPGLQEAGAVEAAQRAAWSGRADIFLSTLDSAVWPWPADPTRQLLETAGLERGDVREMVGQDGLNGALARLRDAGVYVAYEEWAGKQPARRGSTTLHFTPTDFFNRAVHADFAGQSGGSRSGGTPTKGTFGQLHDQAALTAGTFAVRDVLGAPSAAWFPVLPSLAGVGTLLLMLAAGNQPTAWFTQVDPGDVSVSGRKQAVNRLLPYAARMVGVRLPHPRTVAPTEPSPVLDWVVQALQPGGRVLLWTYASSALQLSRAAIERGQRLDGLVLAVGGEPLTAARAREIQESGAEPADAYGASQLGGLAALSCPWSAAEELHVAETAMGVTSRRRRRGDGEEVDALLWTTLLPTSGIVLVNAETDDYGELTVDAEPCECLWGRIGVRQRVSRIRGMSKVVASGVTVRGDVFQTLVDLLPSRCGGSAADYQFVEMHREGVARLVLRIDPRVVDVDEGAALKIVREGLRETEVGRLADDVWAAEGALRVERVAPVRTPAGKVLPLETLR